MSTPDDPIRSACVFTCPHVTLTRSLSHTHIHWGADVHIGHTRTAHTYTNTHTNTNTYTRADADMHGMRNARVWFSSGSRQRERKERSCLVVAGQRLPVELPCFLCVSDSNQNVCEQVIIVWSFERSDKAESLGKSQDGVLILPVVVFIQRHLVLRLASLLWSRCSHYRTDYCEPAQAAKNMSSAASFCCALARAYAFVHEQPRSFAQHTATHSHARTRLNSPNARRAKCSASFRRRPASTTLPDSARVCAWWSAASYASFIAIGAPLRLALELFVW